MRLTDKGIINHFRIYLLILIFFIAGCSNLAELPTDPPAPAPEQIPPTTLIELSKPILPTPTQSLPASRPSECGQLPPLEVISMDNASDIKLLCTLRIPEYQRASVSQCSLSFSPDGTMLAGVCGVSPAPVWDVQSGELRYTLLDEASNQVAVTFSPDGDGLAVGGFSGEVRLFEPSSGKPAGVFSTVPSPVWDLDFAPSSDQMAIATFKDGVFLQTYPDGEPARPADDTGQMATLSVDIAPDGVTMAYGTILNGVWVVDAEKGNSPIHLNVPAPVGDLAFSPDGNWLVTGSDDNLIRIWNTGDYSLAQTMTGHKGFVNGVAFTPDSHLVAAGSKDHYVTVWDVATGSLLTKLEGHQRDVLRLEFNPQGTLIASISWDGTVRIWGVPVFE